MKGDKNMLGTGIALKAINGKLKPKFGKSRYVSLAIFGSSILISIVMMVLGIVTLNYEWIIMPSILLLSSTYLMCISSIMVRNVQVFIGNDGAILVLHKNKPVHIDLVWDNQGKLNFRNPNVKHKCVRYADGSNMSSIQKYRIINYFSDVLHSCGLLSDDVRFTIEM